MNEAITRIFQRLMRRIKLPFQALVKASTGGLGYTLEKGLSRRDRKDIASLQHYGLVSRLPVGTKVLVIPRLGKSEKLVIVSEGHETALSLSEGDVALERKTGEHVLLKDGSIEVNAAGGAVNITADSVNIAGSGGKALVTVDHLPIYTGHTHPESGGGTTSPPTQSSITEKTTKTKAL